MLWLVCEIYVDVFADDCRELPTGGGSNRMGLRSGKYSSEYGQGSEARPSHQFRRIFQKCGRDVLRDWGTYATACTSYGRESVLSLIYCAGI